MSAEILSDYLVSALRYLHGHPRSSAREIAPAIAMHHRDREVYAMLRSAASKGYAQCLRERPNAGWRWSVTQRGLDAVAASEQAAREGAP